MDFDACSQSTLEYATQYATQRPIEGFIGGFCMGLGPLLRDGLGRAPHQGPPVRLWKGKNRQRAFRSEKLERLVLSPSSQADLG